MKRFFNSLIDCIEYRHLEKLAFILLILWAISPMIEFILRNFIHVGVTFYFKMSVYIIGIYGILEYIVYLIKLKKDKKLNLKKFFPVFLIILLVIIATISSFLAKDVHLSIFGESYRREGLIVYIMYVGIVLASSLVKNETYIKRIFQIIIISALYITILPLFRIDFTYLKFSNVFHNTNHYGYFIMIAVMLLLFAFIDSKKYQKIIWFFGYIFMVYILIINNTFGCYLAISISLLVLFIYSLVKKYQRLNVIMIICAFILTSFVVSKYNIIIGEKGDFKEVNIVGKNILNFSKDIKAVVEKDEKKAAEVGTHRLLLWKDAWNYTLEHPIFGGGMESLGVYYKEHNNFINDRPHNVILEFSSFIGIPGAIIYLVLILFLAIANLKNLKHNSIYIAIYFTAMCYFISSMFGNSMYYTSPYFMLLIGLLIGMYELNYEKKRKAKLNNT